LNADESAHPNAASYYMRIAKADLLEHS
jgi:hypothetical protein